MIPVSCKRLIEVDFPIAAVSAHSAREKSIRHGHPSTLHLWWARRPLAACRAVLLGLLLPAPTDRECPADFKSRARVLLKERHSKALATDQELQDDLLAFIGEFADWDHAANALYVEIGRGLVKTAHLPAATGDSATQAGPYEPPVVVDPFAGGGSIPLEALRLGCEAFASDLNPVACLILKTLLEDIPRFGNAEFHLPADAEQRQELADTLPDGSTGKFFTYVLRCGDGSLYEGQTDDLRKRFKQHQAGEVEWTAKHCPVELVYYETFDTRNESVEREKYFKSGSGREWLQRKLEKLKADGPACRQTGPASAALRQVNKEIVIHGLAEALRHVGKQVKEAAEKELAEFYPPDPDGSRAIAYLWARTVRCEGIGCGAEIPLVRSFWLCKKPGRKRALRYRVEKSQGKPPNLRFEIFEPKSEKEIPLGTVNRANATCACCNTVLPAERVRAQLSNQRGGGDVNFLADGKRSVGAKLMTVVCVHDNLSGRQYRDPLPSDYASLSKSHAAFAKLDTALTPSETIPNTELRRISVPIYGIKSWGDMMTVGEKLAIATLIKWARKLIGKDSGQGLQSALSLSINRIAGTLTSLSRWHLTGEKIEGAYGRQALGMVWDFCEANPFSDSTGGFAGALEWVANVIETSKQWAASAASVERSDACHLPLSDMACSLWMTDPPYYDSVPYAHLSDFFYVWLKRSLPNPKKDWFANELTDKAAECVVDRPHSQSNSIKTPEYYERKMAAAMGEGRRVLCQHGIGCVVFAHKTTEGWETLLSGMLKAGFVITASWPITTEMATRMVARDTAALAGSVHLVCRPRPADAGIGDWSEVKAAMEKRIRQWLPTLIKHGVRGADAIFSCLGPALESYSRYDKVLTAGDQEVPLGGDPDAIEPEKRGFLAYVFETLSKEALRQVLGDADTEGFEEDARMTALFLWTLQATQGKAEGSRLKAEVETEEEQDEEEGAKPKKAKPGFTMPFDTFIRITRPMGIHYPALEGRVLEIEKGVVRLLSTKERTEALLGEAAERPGIEISLEDFRQLELGLVEKKRTEATLPTKPKKGKKAAPGRLLEEATFTTLDRIHRAMLLFGLGRSTLLRQVLETEMRQGKRFERLALALNALYPDGSDERRMLEGVQAAMRGVK